MHTEIITDIDTGETDIKRYVTTVPEGRYARHTVFRKNLVTGALSLERLTVVRRHGSLERAHEEFLAYGTLEEGGL